MVMEGLFSFLLFAGLFYFMMRHGCGAHMTHGHKDKKAEKKLFYDPVCGLEVEDDEGYAKLQYGSLYRFCSRECLDRFDHEPEKFMEGNNIVSIKDKDNEHGT
jgi:YHS domain-containing protein|tara:strand:+ start:8410 stop:8718 length:309 start_codon:yes stop_codon:yes gene_type:complete